MVLNRPQMGVDFGKKVDFGRLGELLINAPIPNPSFAPCWAVKTRADMQLTSLDIGFVTAQTAR